jgi:HD-like signal output (HDOD) protein
LIAEWEDATVKTRNECFVGGMLHDIGKLLLAANRPTDYQKVTRLIEEGGVSHCVAEKEVFGVDHASVGGYLLGLWGLPVPVVEAIALHHAPQRSTAPGFCALTAVHAANVFEHEADHGSRASTENDLDGPYLASLGLTHRVEAWREMELTAETKGAKANR